MEIWKSGALKYHNIMEIGEIITYIGTALGGGGVVQFFNWRTQKRQARAEAAKAETAVKADQIENLEATIKKVYDPIIERLTGQINQLSGEMERLRAENATLKAENQELRREVDRLNSQALFRNTNRSRDGKFAPRETKAEKK